MTTIQGIPVIMAQNVNSAEKTQTAPKIKLVDPQDTVEFKLVQQEAPVKKSSTGKKWGAGIASFICPGLGQATNGQWGKAMGFFGSAVAIGTMSIVCPAILPLAVLGQLGIGISSIVDAVKNA